MINLNLYNDLEMQEWDSFVIEAPHGSVFHLSKWLKVMHETYGFEPLLLARKNSENRICCLFPSFVIKKPFGGKKCISLPFSDYGGPLFSVEGHEGGILGHVERRFSSNNFTCEIRSLITDDDRLSSRKNHVKHVLSLEGGPDGVWKGVNKKTIKYSIKKAQKLEVKIVEQNTPQGLYELFRLNKMTRKKHGVPSQPFSFFENIYKHLINHGIGSVFLAVWDSKVLAAGLFLKLNDTVYYKYSAADPLYLSEKSPNHLLTWCAIEKACLEGYSKFDFGRTSVLNDGLCRYKEMWGAQRLDLPYCYYPQVSGGSSFEDSGLLYKIVTNVWKRAPDVLVEPIGALIYKHMS